MTEDYPYEEEIMIDFAINHFRCDKERQDYLIYYKNHFKNTFKVKVFYDEEQDIEYSKLSEILNEDSQDYQFLKRVYSILDSFLDDCYQEDVAYKHWEEERQEV